MTDQHPLTDEICEHLSSCVTILTAPGEEDPYICPQYIADDLRAAADWQLEQVLEWLKENTDDYVCEDYYSTYFLTDDFLDGLKKAMRPTTTTQENN